MKKTEMLKKNYEFKRVITKGKYYSGKKIETFIFENNREKKEINFLGLAIGVKRGNAVKRNKIKRLIREAYMKNEDNLKLGKRMVFLWKKNVPIKGTTLEDINEDMKNIFKKAKILKEK